MQIEDEIGNEFIPRVFFILQPVCALIIGGLILFWSFVRLPIAYNYLRGVPSTIDQSVVALLGSDLPRLLLLASAIIGLIIGSLLSRPVTRKLDTVRRDGEVALGVRMYIGLNIWFLFMVGLNAGRSLIERALFGYPSSTFLSDISWSLMVGYFLTAGISIILKYFQLLRHAKSIGSRIKLFESRGGSGFIKPINQVTLKLIPDGPDLY